MALDNVYVIPETVSRIVNELVESGAYERIAPCAACALPATVLALDGRGECVECRYFCEEHD
jgi:hypothetical protein